MSLFLQAGLQGAVPRLRRQPEQGFLHMPGGRRGYNSLFGIKINHIALDFQGNFFITNEPHPWKGDK